MREDIIGGLRNAIGRGEPLEKAVRSFINAGYRESEVREAAKHINEEGAISLSSHSPIIPDSKFPKFPDHSNSSLSLTDKSIKKGTKKQFLTILILAIVLIALVVAFVASIFFKDSIISFLNGLF